MNHNVILYDMLRLYYVIVMIHTVRYAQYELLYFEACKRYIKSCELQV